MLYKLCKIYYKKAVETPEWVPEVVKEPLSQVEKIEKDPRLVNFRETVENFEQPPLEFELRILRKITNYLSSASDSIRANCYNSPVSFVKTKEATKYLNENKKKLDDLLAACLAFYTLTEEEQLQALRTNKIKVGKQVVKFTKWYNTIRNGFYSFNAGLKAVTDFGEGIKSADFMPFEEFPEKKEWDNRPIKPLSMQVVFTTNYLDILGMSSRSEWSSCQDIRPEKLKSDRYMPEYTPAVVGSCLSKNIGIIYLTNGQDYEGRGERMFYRCAVWLVKNTKTNSDVVFIQSMYPTYDENVLTLFKSALSNHIDLPVMSGVAPYALKKYFEKNWAYSDASLDTYYTYDDYKHIALEKPEYLGELSPEDQKEVILKALSNGNYVYLGRANPEWKEYKGFVIKAVEENLHYIDFLDPEWKEYPDILFKLARKAIVEHDSSAMFNIFKKLNRQEYADEFKNLILENLDLYPGVLINYLKPEWDETKNILLKFANKEYTAGLIVNKFYAEPYSPYYDTEFADKVLDIAAKKFPLVFETYIKQNANKFQDLIFKNIQGNVRFIEYLIPNDESYIEAAAYAIQINVAYTKLVVLTLKEYNKLNMLPEIIKRVAKNIPWIISTFYLSFYNDIRDEVIYQALSAPNVYRHVRSIKNEKILDKMARILSEFDYFPNDLYGNFNEEDIEKLKKAINEYKEYYKSSGYDKEFDKQHDEYLSELAHEKDIGDK